MATTGREVETFLASRQHIAGDQIMANTLGIK
jgi:hypothetical protein